MLNFHVLFPWIGCGGAIVLLILLFGTNYMQGNTAAHKYKDGTWLAWLASTAYLIHNVEEYGIDVFGNLYAFPAAMEALMPQASSLPLAFYTTLNVSFFWFAAPFVAALSARYRFMQISMLGILFVNAVGHFGQFFIIGYTPGLLTCLVLFFPIVCWTAVCQYREGNMPKKAFIFSLAIGIFTHALLIGPMFAYIAGKIPVALLIALQVINPILYVLFSWCGNRLLD